MFSLARLQDPERSAVSGLAAPVKPPGAAIAVNFDLEKLAQ